MEFDNTFAPESEEFLHKLNSDLYTVYKVYFPEEITAQGHQVNPSQQMFEVFERIITFFKEFEIFPKIISVSHLYLIFLEVATS